MSKPKYYVVWVGRQTGIFQTWADCSQQIDGYPQAKYKSFPTIEEAEKAMQDGFAAHLTPRPAATKTAPKLWTSSSVIREAIAVDGAWNTKTGAAEYQGVYVKTGQVLFRQGPFADGTNNIVEFLGLVHGLAYLQQHQSDMPIYSDSVTAMSWVRQKRCKTNHAPNAQNTELFKLVARAETWLQTHRFETKILKWETEHWGENPADFGRK